MKKVFLIVTLLFIAVGLYAQVDSTYIPVITSVLNAIEGKYTWVAPLFVVLFFISEGLAQIPAVRANSIFQLIFGYLGIIEKKP